MKKLLLLLILSSMLGCSSKKQSDPGSGSGGFITGNGFRNNIQNASAIAVASSSLTATSGNLVMIDKDGKITLTDAE